MTSAQIYVKGFSRAIR